MPTTAKSSTDEEKIPRKIKKLGIANVTATRQSIDTNRSVYLPLRGARDGLN